MELSEILNLVLGGGLLAAVIGLLTLKATVRKANAEAEKARAEAETVRIDNTEQATRILIDNIVEPLKKELNETREELRATKKEFGSTKREMARLRKAIGDAGNCKHSGDCPVLFRLRELRQSANPGRVLCGQVRDVQGSLEGNGGFVRGGGKTAFEPRSNLLIWFRGWNTDMRFSGNINSKTKERWRIRISCTASVP